MGRGLSGRGARPFTGAGCAGWLWRGLAGGTGVGSSTPLPEPALGPAHAD